MLEEGKPLLRPIGTFEMSAGFPPLTTTIARNSMIGAGIGPGDIMAVEKRMTPQHGNIVIAVVNGEMTVKRLYNIDGVIELRPEKTKYKKITFCEDSNLVIWEVVRNVVKDCV